MSLRPIRSAAQVFRVVVARRVRAEIFHRADLPARSVVVIAVCVALCGCAENAAQPGRAGATVAPQAGAIAQSGRAGTQTYTGAGGPLEPIASGRRSTDEGDVRLAALTGNFQSTDQLRLAAKRMPFGAPVEGAVQTSSFGPRSDPLGRGTGFHTGVDLAGPHGTPIYATATGVVVFAGRERGYGNLVKIRHAFGLETYYAHLSRIRAQVGEHVRRGQQVGDMGSTGESTGTHVHYEVRIDNKPVDPAKFLQAGTDLLHVAGGTGDTPPPATAAAVD